MFQPTIQALTLSAKAKLQRLKDAPFAYLILSMLAGMFIGFAILLSYIIGGLYTLEGSALGAIPMGLSFGVGLSLVLFVGSELFTGNVMLMSVALLQKQVSFKGAITLLCSCYLGNLLGAGLLGLIFYLSGMTQGATGDFFVAAAAKKMTTPGLQLFMRGILCNILVCAAVWTYYRMETEVGKLILVFWCLFAFITPGFEHSIANMSVHSIALLMGREPGVIHLMGALHNLLYSTLGNLVGGGLFLGVAYSYVASKESLG